MLRLNLTPRARQDLDAIYRFSLDRWSERQADTYYLKLISAMQSVADDPHAGTPVDIRTGYRKMLCSAHVIYYRPAPGRIDIIRILHQSMDVKRHL